MVQGALSSAVYRTLDTGFFKELLRATGVGWDKVSLLLSQHPSLYLYLYPQLLLRTLGSLDHDIINLNSGVSVTVMTVVVVSSTSDHVSHL